MIPKLTFINHASYMVESTNSILIVDPYIEGLAFDNSWALLDKSTSNKEIVEKLTTKNKNIFIWYSHEHSDHFSVSFINALKKMKVDVTVLFQKTKDQRVISFTKKLGFKVIESNNKAQKIDSNMFNVVWPYGRHDSYSLLKIEDISILNINDCMIRSKSDVRKVKDNIFKYTDEIDILFTQFGYANWIGNKENKIIRKNAARHKLERITLQAKFLNPKSIVPFASFVYFCHKDNFYLNDEQNNTVSLRQNKSLKKYSNKIYFMKPSDSINLIKNKISSSLNNNSFNAEMHWENSYKKRKIIDTDEENYSLQDLNNSFSIYRRKLMINFLFSVPFFQWLGFMLPINVRVKDHQQTYLLSYFNNELVKLDKNNQKYDICLTSAVLKYIFKFEYGFDSTWVNGKFSIQHNEGLTKVKRFFKPQDYMRRGRGLKRPLYSVIVLIKGLLLKENSRHIRRTFILSAKYVKRTFILSAKYVKRTFIRLVKYVKRTFIRLVKYVKQAYSITVKKIVS